MRRTAVCGLMISMLMMPQPSLAAEDIRPSHNPERQSAVFAGANVTIPLGRAATRRPRARLQLTTIHKYRDAGSASPQTSHRSPGLELGLTRSNRPSLFVGGKSSEEIERRLGMNGDTTTWVVVGGVVVVLIVVVALASSGGCLAPSMEPDC